MNTLDGIWADIVIAEIVSAEDLVCEAPHVSSACSEIVTHIASANISGRMTCSHGCGEVQLFVCANVVARVKSAPRPCLWHCIRHEADGSYYAPEFRPV